MPEELIQELKNLNLSEKEARVYLALLELGPATPYKISKRAHLKRPTVYVVTEELVEKGLIVPMTGERQKMYIARSPEGYIEDVENRVRDARRILPELKALQRKQSEKPNILYFEGIEGLRQAYDYRFKEFTGKEIVGFFAREKDVDPRVHKEVFDRWNEKREAAGIQMRGFTVDDPRLASYARFFGAGEGKILAKFIPESLYNADCSLEAFDWGVRIVIMRSKQALVIESYELATALKQIFELLWSKSEGEYDRPKKLDLKKV